MKKGSVSEPFFFMRGYSYARILLCVGRGDAMRRRAGADANGVANSDAILGASVGCAKDRERRAWTRCIAGSASNAGFDRFGLNRLLKNSAVSATKDGCDDEASA